jgi:hypothetical protein
MARLARTAGLFYALDIVTGSLSLFFAGKGLGTYADAANLVATVCYVVVVLLFFELFRPVNPTLSLVTAGIGLVGCASGALAVFDISPGGISPLAFFGAYCLLIGYLILRSRFLPPVLGVLMIVGGLGWLTFVSPALAGHLKPWNMLPGVLGETVLTVWLLAKGVNAERWSSQATAHQAG